MMDPLKKILLGLFLILGVSAAFEQIRLALTSDSLPRATAWQDDDTKPVDMIGASDVQLSGFLTVAYYDSRAKDRHRVRLVLAVDDGRILPVRLFQDGITSSQEITKKVRNQLLAARYTFGNWKLKDGVLFADHLHLGFDPKRKPRQSFQIHLQPVEFLNVKGTLPIGEIAARWVGTEADLPQNPSEEGHSQQREFVIADILKSLHVPFDRIDLTVSDPVAEKWDRFSCFEFGWWNQWIEMKPSLHDTEFLIHPAVASCPYSSISLLGVGRVLLNGVFGHSSRQMLHAFLHTRGLRHLGANHNESGDETCLMGTWWVPSVLSRWAVGWLPETDMRVIEPAQVAVESGGQLKLSLAIPESAAGELKLIRFGKLLLSTDSGALRGPPGFPLLVHRVPLIEGNDQLHSSYQREAVLYHGQKFSFEGLEVEAGESLPEGRVELILRSTRPKTSLSVVHKKSPETSCLAIVGSEKGDLSVRTLTTNHQMSFQKPIWKTTVCDSRKGLNESFSLSWKGAKFSEDERIDK